MVKLSAQKAEGEWGEKQGLRLEGTVAQPARVSHPQLDVAAPKIEVNFDDKRQFTRVNATGGVSFAVTLKQQKDGPSTRIEAKCDNAMLERPTTGANAGTRVLTLRGGVDGWYQLEGGPRNALRGQTVTLNSKPGAAESLLANIEGGPEGVRLEVPPATAPVKGGTGQGAPGSPPGAPLVSSHGPVIITAQSAVLRQQKDGLSADVEGGERGVRMEIQPGANASGNDLVQGVVVTSRRATVRQGEGAARFIGSAHAASIGGKGKIDVTADEIMLTRNAKGDFDLVKTGGRAKVKVDLSQLKAQPAAPPATAPAAPDGQNDKQKKPAMRPEYLEFEADSAEAQLAKNQLVFEGNLRGFYRLPAQEAKPNQPPSPTDYPFVGQRAVLSYTPGAADPAQSWTFVFKGLPNAPVEIWAPAFQLDEF